jgi:hypothetical protein
MIMNMLSFDISKGFQDKCNCLESLKTTRVRTTARVRKSTRVKKGCQVSRNQNLKSLEDWQITRVQNQENNSKQNCSIPSSKRRRKREKKERLQSQKHVEIQKRNQ